MKNPFGLVGLPPEHENPKFSCPLPVGLYRRTHVGDKEPPVTAAPAAVAYDTSTQPSEQPSPQTSAEPEAIGLEDNSAPLAKSGPPPRGRGSHARIAHEEFFDYQRTSTADLPDPQPLVENLTRCVIEILAGARELEQVARWVTDDVYRTLLTRASISARARTARGAPVVRPTFAVGTPLITSPRDGVVEAVVIVTSRARARAVAIRLEGLDRRWRASAISVL
jgi:hypothetical protein